MALAAVINNQTIVQTDRWQGQGTGVGPTVEAYVQVIPPGWRRSGERPT